MPSGEAGAGPHAEADGTPGGAAAGRARPPPATAWDLDVGRWEP